MNVEPIPPWAYPSVGALVPQPSRAEWLASLEAIGYNESDEGQRTLHDHVARAYILDARRSAVAGKICPFLVGKALGHLKEAVGQRRRNRLK